MTRRTLPDRPLRTDAARNRTAIVAAAQRAFAESGLQVPFDEIARRAGVGEATLYRRFPDRASLIAAAFCMYNRYVDGLGTVVADQEGYDMAARRIVEHGYTG